MNKEKIMYHVTDGFCCIGILKEGLIPKNQLEYDVPSKSHLSDSNFVYLFDNLEDASVFGKTLCESDTGKKNRKYILKVEIPYYVKVERDLNAGMERTGAWKTSNSIPTENIIPVMCSSKFDGEYGFIPINKKLGDTLERIRLDGETYESDLKMVIGDEI